MYVTLLRGQKYFNSSDYIDNNLTLPFINVANVNTPSWSRFLYKSVTIRENYGYDATVTCSILDPAESLACEILFMDGNDCYFGSSSTNSTAYSFSMSNPIDVAMKPGKKRGVKISIVFILIFVQILPQQLQQEYSRQM